jgi:hypothetical protein
MKDEKKEEKVDRELMDEFELEFADEDPDDFGSMAPEEVEWYMYIREHVGPTPDFSEGYVDPFTGEVIIEGPEETPEVLELRAESERLFRERVKAEREAEAIAKAKASEN